MKIDHEVFLKFGDQSSSIQKYEKFKLMRENDNASDSVSNTVSLPNIETHSNKFSRRGSYFDKSQIDER